MINKFYKSFYNNYSKFLKFLFFLRYVITISLIAITLFLSIPKLFNYEKKQDILKNYLFVNYNLEINNFKTIKFNIFPIPNLSLINADLKIKDKSINFKTKNLYIFLNFKNIYNYENFKANKIILNDNEIFLEASKVKEFINYLDKTKPKLEIKNLNINLEKNNDKIIKINSINFLNYGYKKNYIEGEIFEKRFKITLKDNNHKLKFKLLKTGLTANFEFDKKKSDSFTSGSSKIKLLNNFLRFNFNINENNVRIIKSNFRNRYLSFSLDSLLKFNPYFKIDSNININEFNEKLLDYLSFEKIVQNQDIIKKINGNIKIKYKSKKYSNNIIEENYSSLNFTYGRLFFENKILFLGGELNCTGNTILVAEFPKLNFICLVIISDKKKLLKKFSIKKENNTKIINLNIEGSLNLLNKKVNFKKINIGKEFVANDEDIKFFKEKFQNILFDEGFFKLFSKEKIKKFIVEIT